MPVHIFPAIYAHVTVFCGDKCIWQVEDWEFSDSPLVGDVFDMDIQWGGTKKQTGTFECRIFNRRHSERYISEAKQDEWTSLLWIGAELLPKEVEVFQRLVTAQPKPRKKK